MVSPPPSSPPRGAPDTTSRCRPSRLCGGPTTTSRAWRTPRALWRVPRSNWRRKALLLLPDFVTAEDVRAARETLSDKRGGDPLPRCVRLERIDEGACVQVLHVGPYAEEPETVRKMQVLMKENGLTPCGFHHEIYLGDPRRPAPARLRTILRQPVR